MKEISAALVLAVLAPSSTGQGAAPGGAPEEPLELGLRLSSDGAFPGYTLVNPLNGTKAALFDMEGKVVHEWETGTNPGGLADLLDDGSLVRSAVEPNNPRFNGGGMGGRLQRFSWEGELVWELVMADDFQTLHHDIEPLPNGNFLVIAWEHLYTEDAIAYGRDPEAIGEKGMWCDSIYELEPTLPEGAEVVWEWHVWDHLIQDFDPDAEYYGSIPDHPERIDINADHRGQPAMTEAEKKRQAELEEEMRAVGYAGDSGDGGGDADAGGANTRSTVPDWLHTNAVAYHPGLDLIVLSTPNLSEIWVIDHSLSSEDAAENTGGRFGKGGGLLYRWGNPRNYGRGDHSDRTLFYQHDPTWLGGADDLRILVFNNGSGRPGDYSSVEELHLPFDPERGFELEPGEAYGPDQPSWIYVDRGNFYSAFISGAQRLPNGNTLICEGAKGRVFEVTPKREIVWDFVNPMGADAQPVQGQPSVPRQALFRATRIPLDHPAVRERLAAK